MIKATQVVQGHQLCLDVALAVPRLRVAHALRLGVSGPVNLHGDHQELLLALPGADFGDLKHLRSHPVDQPRQAAQIRAGRVLMPAVRQGI